jgi:hypothetical protein
MWAAALAATGCTPAASTRPDGAPTVRAGEFGRQDCFVRREADDFDVLDASNLLLYVPDRRTAYHVHVSPPSPELRHAQALAFQSRHSRVCGYAGDRLVVDAAGSVEEHAITGVYRVDEAAVATLRGRFGLAPRTAPPAPATPPPGEVQRDLGAPPSGP